MADSKEIVRVFRSYNKDKGWPMAHEAADLIEKLEKEQADWKRVVKVLLEEVALNNPEIIQHIVKHIPA